MQIANVSVAMEGCTMQPVADILAASPHNAVHAFTFPQAAVSSSGQFDVILNQCELRGSCIEAYLWQVSLVH